MCPGGKYEKIEKIVDTKKKLDAIDTEINNLDRQNKKDLEKIHDSIKELEIILDGLKDEDKAKFSKEIEDIKAEFADLGEEGKLDTERYVDISKMDVNQLNAYRNKHLGRLGSKEAVQIFLLKHQAVQDFLKTLPPENLQFSNKVKKETSSRELLCKYFVSKGIFFNAWDTIPFIKVKNTDNLGKFDTTKIGIFKQLFGAAGEKKIDVWNIYERPGKYGSATISADKIIVNKNVENLSKEHEDNTKAHESGHVILHEMYDRYIDDLEPISYKGNVFTFRQLNELICDCLDNYLGMVQQEEMLAFQDRLLRVLMVQEGANKTYTQGDGTEYAGYFAIHKFVYNYFYNTILDDNLRAKYEKMKLANPGSTKNSDWCESVVDEYFSNPQAKVRRVNTYVAEAKSIIKTLDLIKAKRIKEMEDQERKKMPVTKIAPREAKSVPVELVNDLTNL